MKVSSSYTIKLCVCMYVCGRACVMKNLKKKMSTRARASHLSLIAENLLFGVDDVEILAVALEKHDTQSVQEVPNLRPQKPAPSI